MILFKKLHSHFGALAVTFAEFQIIQDELLALYSMVVSTAFLV